MARNSEGKVQVGLNVQSFECRPQPGLLLGNAHGVFLALVRGRRFDNGLTGPFPAFIGIHTRMELPQAEDRDAVQAE